MNKKWAFALLIILLLIILGILFWDDAIGIIGTTPTSSPTRTLTNTPTNTATTTPTNTATNTPTSTPTDTPSPTPTDTTTPTNTPISIVPTDEVEVPEIIVPIPHEHPMANDNTMGDPNALVVIEQFSDFQCSHCRNFFRDTEQLIINEYVATGQVYFIYRSRGDSAGGDSGRAIEAAYCAGDQNKFWEMHDIIYANFSSGNSGGYSAERLTAMAEAIGLNVNTFEDCLKDRKYRDRVVEDRSAAQEKGVFGTPTFFINGIIIEGNEPYATFQAKIEAALSSQGN